MTKNQEIKSKLIEEEEMKLSLFTDYMTVYRKAKSCRETAKINK